MSSLSSIRDTREQSDMREKEHPSHFRLPSDVCYRIAALDLIQKRRGGMPGQGPPLPKRQSLPSLFEQSILRRTTVSGTITYEHSDEIRQQKKVSLWH